MMLQWFQLEFVTQVQCMWPTCLSMKMHTSPLLGMQSVGRLLAPTSWAINTAMSDEDQVSSKWLKMLLYESCTMEMKEVLMLEYGNLDVCFRGGVTFAWMLCNKFVGLNWDTTAELVNFLKLFWNKGLRCYQGENVALALKELLSVCSCLAEAKELPQETPVDLLTGLTLCLVEQFKTLFKHKLQQAKAMVGMMMRTTTSGGGAHHALGRLANLKETREVK